jgi:acyl transferase domain-containing protein/phosphopantetheinyl transferase
LSVEAPEDIAIIGMAGTFAKAPDVATYWSNILGKVDAIGDAPPDWIGDEVLFDPAATPDKMRIYTQRGGFLGDLARFDPRPFGTMPVALGGGEPDQFLALKAAVAALEDAGYAKRDFARERTGIILGHGIHANRGNVNGMQQGLFVAQTVGILQSVFPELTPERCRQIEDMLNAKLPILSVDTLPSLVPNVMTGRIANRLDLMGPNYIIDAACASSLLSIESAVTELRTGRADMMLAGGVNTTTSPLVYMVFCKIGALSRRPGIRPFDKSADGTLLGEGQGIVVLKRLADATRDGDHIYAVIKGTGAASDGRAMGLMAPRLEGEVLAIRRAYAGSGIDPATIDLIEAHGTGIPLGDELEVKALTAVLGERQGKVPRVAFGSVKSMIGHCIPAAGIASVIKMAMALDQKVLPPTLANEINPALGLERTPLFLNTEAQPWLHRRDAPRRAGINAFGFGGINTHMILEEAPDTGAAGTATFGLRAPRSAELFLLVADTRAALVDAAHALAAQADAMPWDLRRVAVEAHDRLGDGGFRLAVIAADAAALRGKLLRAIDKIASPDRHRLRGRDGVFFADEAYGGKVAFLFPGENSQYANMLRDLALASPSVREWLDRLEGLFHGERDVSHRFLLFPPPLGLSDAEKADLAARLHRVDNGSEAVFFADMAIFSLLTSLGVRADFMAGHSTGENAAIVASGLFGGTIEDVCDHIRRMNTIFAEIEKGERVPTGTLLSVGAIDRGAIEAVLARHDDVHFTMDNCPNQAILFGPVARMEDVGIEFLAKGAICTALPLSWAYHTPFVAPMADAFDALWSDRPFALPSARLYSCASAGPFPDDVADVRRQAHAQYVSRVRFTETVQRLYEDGARIFIEVGPGNILTGFVGDTLRGRPHLALASDSSRGSSLEQMLYLVGQLFVHRVRLDLGALYPDAGGAPVRLDTDPSIASAIPFIHLDAEQSAQLREMLVGTLAVPGLPAPTVAPATLSPAPALSDHFELMNDFLRNQDIVTGRVVEQQEKGHEPPVACWTGTMPLPFAAAVEFISADGLPQALFVSSLLPLLGRCDLDYFERVIMQEGPRRQQDWLIGRIAARRAVSAWRSGRGDDSALPESEISYDAEGRPVLTCSSARDALFLSISHKAGVAVAAASDRPVGIDLERFSALRDPDGVMRVAFSPAEATLLADAGGDDAQLVAIAWSAKEAVAKSLGQKLLGREQSFTMRAFDPANALIRVAHAEQMIDAYFAVDGDFVCTVAASLA